MCARQRTCLLLRAQGQVSRPPGRNPASHASQHTAQHEKSPHEAGFPGHGFSPNQMLSVKLRSLSERLGISAGCGFTGGVLLSADLWFSPEGSARE